MVTGNFAMLAGIDPAEVHRWYLAVYADAYEWVELPNTLGNGQPLDPRLAAIINTAMEKDPADRFQSAREMREALEAIDQEVEIVEDEGLAPAWPKYLAIVALVLVLAMVGWLALS